MEKEHFIKRCYELAVDAGKKGFDTFGAVRFITERSLRKRKTVPITKHSSLAMLNLTWCINAQISIPIKY